MEKEGFFSGYCRQTDGSRMVTAVTEDGKLVEVDCCYPDCSYAPNCTVAEKLRQFVEE